jgi:hypothetical protein
MGHSSSFWSTSEDFALEEEAGDGDVDGEIEEAVEEEEEEVESEEEVEEGRVVVPAAGGVTATDAEGSRLIVRRVGEFGTEPVPNSGASEPE